VNILFTRTHTHTHTHATEDVPPINTYTHTYVYTCTLTHILQTINSKIFAGTNVELGAQTVYFEKKGAFTEAVSSCQVKSLGAIHCLTGHSEERTLFKATDDLINKVCVCDVVLEREKERD